MILREFGKPSKYCSPLPIIHILAPQTHSAEGQAPGPSLRSSVRKEAHLYKHHSSVCWQLLSRAAR